MALKVAPVTVRGHWVRHTPPGSAPIPTRDPAPDNRWQRGDVVDALYLADCEDTAWAEWYRHLAERAIPPLAQMPRELWTWRVDVEVADLSSPEKLRAVELDPPHPRSKSWQPYQEIGEQLLTAGWNGLLAPSAARPNGMILCLFRDGTNVNGAQPIGRPKKIDQPPPPPAGLRT